MMNESEQHSQQSYVSKKEENDMNFIGAKLDALQTKVLMELSKIEKNEKKILKSVDTLVAPPTNEDIELEIIKESAQYAKKLITILEQTASNFINERDEKIAIKSAQSKLERENLQLRQQNEIQQQQLKQYEQHMEQLTNERNELEQKVSEYRSKAMAALADVNTAKERLKKYESENSAILTEDGTENFLKQIPISSVQNENQAGRQQNRIVGLPENRSIEE